MFTGKFATKKNRFYPREARFFPGPVCHKNPYIVERKGFIRKIIHKNSKKASKKQRKNKA